MPSQAKVPSRRPLNSNFNSKQNFKKKSTKDEHTKNNT